MTTTTELNTELEPCVLTDKTETKTVPCRKCGRPCVVTRFASPHKTECTDCRGTKETTALEVDESLTPETLTDAERTKTVPCRKCRRACVVTAFASAEKVECTSCRGAVKQKKKQAVQIQRAHTIDPATVADLRDALINPKFRELPLCPFDPDHVVELKSVTHSPSYGPRHLLGYDGKGYPQYDEQTGESVMYQCNSCLTTISFSTQHQVLLCAQNEAREIRENSGISIWSATLGERGEQAA